MRLLVEGVLVTVGGLKSGEGHSNHYCSHNVCHIQTNVSASHQGRDELPQKNRPLEVTDVTFNAL